MWKFSRTSSSLRRATQELLVETQNEKYCSNKILMLMCAIIAFGVIRLFNVSDLLLPDLSHFKNDNNKL